MQEHIGVIFGLGSFYGMKFNGAICQIPYVPNVLTEAKQQTPWMCDSSEERDSCSCMAHIPRKGTG